MPWSLIGAICAAALAAFAFWRSRQPGGHYDDEIYGMTHVSHIRYTLAALGFAILFAVSAYTQNTTLLLPIGAAFALLAVFYGTSFLRGFSDAHDDD
jgi:hypothetical protein